MGNEQCCQESANHGFYRPKSYKQINQATFLHRSKSLEIFSSQKKSSSHSYEASEINNILQKDLENQQSKIKTNLNTSSQKSFRLPPLNFKVQNCLLQIQPQFQKFFVKQKSKIKQFGEDTYEGQFDEIKKVPHGFGKLYKKDESLYIGHFNNGKAHGFGTFILPNGSYYRGQFQNNIAQSQKSDSYFKDDKIQYKGSFKNNMFHGIGKQKGQNYQFNGTYKKGLKQNGVLLWKDSNNQIYEYNGDFNSNSQFEGEGILREPTGEYNGTFKNGLKHGKGIYKYKNGLRYEGEYKNGLRQGMGTIYNNLNIIAYEGQMHNGVPHGIGYIYNSKNQKFETEWHQGIQSKLL